MRKTKEQKAITLIALIITIVVLLILAVVAINAVTGDGIIQHATNAKTAYENAQAKEQDVLSYYETYLTTKGNVGPWKQDGNYVTMTDGENNTIKIPIGAKVNNYKPIDGKTYTSSYTATGLDEGNDQTFTVSNLDWYIMGVEDGKVLLLSSTIINPEGYTSGYGLFGRAGTKNGLDEFNKICSIYKDNTYAESARSLTLEDIGKVAGISEANKKTLTDTYGTKYKVEYKEGSVWYYIDGDTTGANTQKTEIYLVDQTINASNPGPITITDNRWIDEDILSAENTVLSLIKNGGDSWLASRISYVANSDIPKSMTLRFGYYICITGSESATQMGQKVLYTSDNTTAGTAVRTCGIRPVIVLNKDVKLTKNSDGQSWDLSK